MKSQVKWGLFFIAVGLVLALVSFPITLIYSVPLVIIGVSLIVLRWREAIIEGRND